MIVVASLPGISQATRYGVLRKGLRKKKKKKNLVQRWWRVVTVRSLQTISRYAALWFWDLVCSAAVRSLRVLGRSPVCRSFLLTRETVESWPFWFLLFSFLQYDMVHSHWPWCYCSHVGLTRKFSFNVGSFFAMCEPLASQLWKPLIMWNYIECWHLLSST